MNTDVIEARGTGFIELIRAVEAEGSFVSRVTVRGNGVYECRVTRGQTQPFTHSNAQDGHVTAQGDPLGEATRPGHPLRLKESLGQGPHQVTEHFDPKPCEPKNLQSHHNREVLPK